MTAPTTADIAQALVRAHRSAAPIEAAPLAGALADSVAAYAAQDAVGRELGWFASAPAQHWKSGGPSRSAVATHAPLPPAGVLSSPANVAAMHFNLRGIEAEVALRLAVDVDAATAAALDDAGAAKLVDAMAVSIEIVDSRWREGFGAPQLLKLADLQSHGALVLGDWQPYAARDWAAQTCRVHIGANPVFEARGAHSMGDPAFVLAGWLRHATRDGARVAKGTVVTTGTWCGILMAAAGDLVTVAFDGIGSASLQF